MLAGQVREVGERLVSLKASRRGSTQPLSRERSRLGREVYREEAC